MGDYSFVRRKSGAYMRRKRGSVKPATVNAVLQSFTDRNKVVTKTAMQVNNVMKIYAGYFREGAFWPNLLSRLRKCPNDELATHLNSLAELELNKEHRFTSFNQPTYDIESNKAGFTVQLGFNRHPDFKRNKANCYYYELVAILWGQGVKVPLHRSVETNWVSFKDDVPDYAIYFSIQRSHLWF